MPTDSIVARLLGQANRRPHHPAYFVKRDGGWRPVTYGDYGNQVCSAARALVALGVEAGENVCILGFNRPEWAIFNFAAMAAGGAAAGIYTTSSAEEVAYILGHAEARVVLVEDQAQWQKVASHWHELPRLERIVLMSGAQVDDPRTLTWEAFSALAESVPVEQIHGRIDALQPDDLATLIYTSGTTGPPKGVMLSHKNLTWTATLAGNLVRLDEYDCTLSYLPLSHIAEQIFTLHGAVTYGYMVYFAESLEAVRDNLVEVEPTVLFAVPRIWEKFHAGIEGKLTSASPAKKALFSWATGVGRRYHALRNASQAVPGILQLQHRLASRLVYSRVKGALGLGRLRFAVSGAAPISAGILEFFSGLDIVVLEVYGQSEDTGPTSFNRPGCTSFGTVGPPVPGVDVRIADDGEILVRGPNVFLGYYKDPEATAQTLKEGWLYSGDLGRIDDRGFLHITGRKKEIIITAGGKNIAPKNIENALKEDPMVNEAVIIGDRRKYLSALIWLDPDAAARLASEYAVSVTQITSHTTVLQTIQVLADGVNRQFAQVEHIRRFTLLLGPLSVDDGELTPTLKVKRQVIATRYAAQIETMYDP